MTNSKDFLQDGGVHRYPVRVYFQDTDAGATVYHGAYLQFAERARIESLRDLGMSLAEDGLIFAVRRCHLEYHSPGFLDDLLTIETRVIGYTRTSLSMRQSVMRGETLLVDVTILMVCMRLGQGWKPRRIPTPIALILNRFRELGLVSKEASVDLKTD